MKTEYIKREALRKAMSYVYQDPTCPMHIAAEVDQYITETPTIEVEPVRHGQWESMAILVEYMKFKYCYACTACGQIGGDTKTNYCPNCGAKMDGEINV